MVNNTTRWLATLVMMASGQLPTTEMLDYIYTLKCATVLQSIEYLPYEK